MKRNATIDIVGEVAVPKVISFVGTGRGDIMYYLSRYLDADGKKVLFVDNSEDKDIYNSIKKVEGETIGYQRNITFVKNVMCVNAVLVGFDYIIVNHGKVINEKWMECTDYFFLMTNYEPSSMDQVKVAVDKINEFVNREGNRSEKMTLIFRDKAIKSQKELRFLKEMGIEKVPFSEIFVLYHDVKDYSSYLEFLYAGRQSVAKADLSSEMLELLHYMVKEILDKDKRSMKKLERAVAKKPKGGLFS